MGPQEPGSRPPPRLRAWRALCLAAATLFAVLALDAGGTETPTIDEFAHLPSGHAILAHGAFDLYAKNPPLGKALLALPERLGGDLRVPVPREQPFGWGPWQYGRRFMQANADRYFSIFASARALVTALALIAAALVFFWARSLFGEPAAAISTSLFLLSPTLLAHGHLATLDVACMASLLACILALRWAHPPDGADRLGRVATTGALWGIALLVKFTAVLLAPVWIGLVAYEHRRRWRRALAEIALLGAVGLTVVNLGMGFRGSFAPLGTYDFGSDFARGLQRMLPDATPVPLPHDYVRGFDAQKRDVERAEFPAYLHGEWSREGWWYYEAAALAVKTPLPLLAVLALTPWALRRRGTPPRELAYLLLPPLALGALLTGLNQLNVGVRYLLPLYPFAFVATAALWAGDGRLARWLGIAAVCISAVGAVRIHPAHLTYFNPIAGGPDGGYHWLLDSNLDWGQDLHRLSPALERIGHDGPVHLLYFGHVDPALYGIDFRVAPDRPVHGIVAASVTYLQGFVYPAAGPGGRPARVRPGHLDWLSEIEPSERLGSIWLFDTRALDAPAP